VDELRAELRPDLTPDLNPDLTPDLTPDLIRDLNTDLNPDLTLDLIRDLNPDLIPDQLIFPDRWYHVSSVRSSTAFNRIGSQTISNIRSVTGKTVSSTDCRTSGQVHPKTLLQHLFLIFLILRLSSLSFLDFIFHLEFGDFCVLPRPQLATRDKCGLMRCKDVYNLLTFIRAVVR
jgi:hypothetical protein